MTDTATDKHLQITSDVPGRLRIRVAARHRGKGCLARVDTGISARAGVNSVDTNEDTGGILIQYDPEKYDRETALADVREIIGLSADPTEKEPESDPYLGIADVAMKVLGKLSAWITWVTGRNIDLRYPVPVGFGVAGAALVVSQGGLGLQDLHKAQLSQASA